ncbi:hypothetical protein DFH06DRAFT_1467123 [Mycena polygramma]|nr:hypothetical protein DFH06DRAFT_1467123 [Mycena polygramma]
MSVKLFELQGPTIRDRLRHNILPSDEGRSAIMESLVVAQQRLAEIHGIDVSVEGITLCEYISEYSSLLAPIRRLTHDILENIFADPEISQMIRIGRTTPSLVVGRNPYVLASVSHYWMCVSLQTPELWSKFYIHACTNDRALNQLRVCLERSGTVPLSIDLTLPRVLRSGGFTSFNGEILNELMAYAERWGRLRVSMTNENIALLAPVHGRLHQLKEIIFDIRVKGTKAPGGPSNIFEVAPELRIAGLACFYIGDEFPILPFGQIEKVVFSGADNICCATLSKFSNVQELVVAYSQTRELPPGTPLAPQLHLTLKKIALGQSSANGDCRNAMDVLDRLTAPNLEELHVTDKVWEAASIEHFLTRSDCSLQILVLKTVRVRAGELLAVLRQTPTLRTLALRDSTPNSLTDILISALTPTNASQMLLRALNDLTIVGTYLFSTNGILRMLEGRAASLHVVDLVLPDRPVGTADRARFAALCSASIGVWWLRCLDEERKPVEVQ